MSKMKAYTNPKYGSPDVMEIQELPLPEPKDKEVRVRVKAISLNPAESHLMRGSIWIIRLSHGLRKPKKPVLPADLAGVVDAVGKEVNGLKVGDRVMGRAAEGGMAAFACLKTEHCTRLPESISFEEGAALPLASLTALVALRKGKANKGQKVLIIGASGGIGTIAVQLAKYMGLEVSGVCSSGNADLVLSLGADRVIAYDKEDFSKSEEKYDLILDLIGSNGFAALNKVLAPMGRCVMVGFTNFSKMAAYLFRGGLASLFSRKSFITMDAKIKPEDLDYVLNLVEKGNIRPVIDRNYPFVELPAAFTYLASKRAKGKIVVKVEAGTTNS